MTKRIFRSILAVALAVLLAGVGLIIGVLYSNFSSVQHSQLRIEAQLAAQGVEKLGLSYFDTLSIQDSRITWIAADGTVLYDNQSDAASMGNHADREEVTEALSSGWGESFRYSDTMMERSIYYAVRLSDGTVLRLSSLQDTVLTVLLDMGYQFLLIVAVALVLSLVLAARLSRKIVKPLNQLDLDDPLSNEGYDEVAPLLGRIHSQQQLMRAQAAELRRKQEEFDAVTENMRDGLVLLGSGDDILSINPAAARFLGADMTCIGRDILSVNRMPQIQTVLSAVREGRHGKAAVCCEEREYRLAANPVYSDGRLTGVVLLIRDVTDREQAERMRQEFTANVSHELKTPLHAISGYAELMAGGMVKQEDVPQFSANIYHETKRMIRLIEDILKLSQLDEGAEGFAWEQVELLELTKQTVDSLRLIAQQAQVSVNLTGRPVAMEGITQLVSAIVHNLCDNAIKYNRSGGLVTVSVLEENGEAVLRVVDTGIGIPAENQARIFERFYRVDKSRSKEVGGTGLGLSIVKHAAKILGARVQLQSAAGAGTSVTVRFPLKKR